MRRTSPSRQFTILILALLTFSISALAQFIPTGNLVTSRMMQTATFLNSGKVLVVGGLTGGFQGIALSSVELYDPAVGTFSSTGALNTARILSTATLLNNGKVLIACGYDTTWSAIATTEVYDPASGTVAVSGSVNTARGFQSATLLGSGMVLIAGGEANNYDALADAELYNPATGAFTATGAMTTGHEIHTATLLNNGKVLIAGGLDSNGYPITTAELYDPAAGTFASTGSLNIGRAVHTATLLNNGKVLVAGGYDTNFNAVAAAELYDPSTGTFTLTGSLNVSRYDGAQGTLLTNGMVLFAGGQDLNGNTLSSAELYDPVAGTFSVTTGSMMTTRQSLTTTLLGNGQVLVAAGMDYDANVLNSAELFQPSTLTPTGLVSIALSPSNPTISVGSTQAFTAVGTFSDNSTQTLASVTWTSSNSNVATIANDASNHGNAIALATGSSTVSACAGMVCGSATMNVTSTLVSIALSPANSTIMVGTGQQITATGTFSDASTLDITTSANWSSSNSSMALIGNTSGFQGFAMGATTGTATITATLGSVSGNTTLTVQSAPTINAPTITSVSSSSGAPGAQVTIYGSAFGATQGTGTIWLGSTYGTGVSWGDTQIVATVASISTSGTAQVQQSGVSSNAVPFNVNSAAISGISTNNGVPGTQVTISGSGFGAVQGSGQAWLGTAYGVVQSWSDTQVVAAVGSGATSGSAQILQGGVWSNSLPFTVNSLHVATVTPTSGGPGTSVTIVGTGFGSSQGSGVVWLGSTNGQVTSWSDTQVVAVVDPTALTGVARIQQSGVWSNAQSFTVPSSGASSLTIVPNLLNMVLGETKTVQALNASSQPVTGLTWTSTNPTVVSLSTDDPPILTALAVGRTTVTAGTASTDVTVFAGPLPVGTVIWSNPGNGSGVQYIVPAVPSSTGVADVFAFQSDGTVQAITSGGATAWTANLNGANYWETVPDFQGGLVVAKHTAPQSIMKLDGITGQPNPAYTPATQNDVMSLPVVHTDGTIFTVDTNTTAATASVIGINPSIGAQSFSVLLDQSTFSSSSLYSGSCHGVVGGVPSSSTSTGMPTVIASPIIAGDGYTYIVYTYQVESDVFQTTTGCNVDGDPTPIYESSTKDIRLHLMMLRVGSGGDSSKIDLNQSWGSRSVSVWPGSGRTTTVQVGAIPTINATPITNADKGAVLGWEADMPAYCASYNNQHLPPVCNDQFAAASTFGFASTVDTSLAFSANLAAGVVPVLQAQDGTFYGTDSTYSKMIHFDLYGNTIWSVPNDYPQIAIADGGVVGYSGVTYDNQGRATGQDANIPVQSWTGNFYDVGSVDQKALDLPLPATPNFWSFDQANQSQNRTSGICHDSRDQLIAEYPTYNAGFVPVCSDFTPSSVSQPTTDFSFAELNTSDIQRNEYPNWAILKARLLSGLEDWRADYGQPLTINSGYRSPLVQNIINSSAPRDRHIHGDAADAQAGTDPVWNDLHDSALAVGGCVEPKNLSGIGHVHTDWRQDDWRDVCPATWRQ